MSTERLDHDRDPNPERLTSRLTGRRQPLDEVVHCERWGGVAR